MQPFGRKDGIDMAAMLLHLTAHKMKKMHVCSLQNQGAIARMISLHEPL